MVPASFPIVLVGDVVRILHGNKLSPLCAVLSALSDTLALFKEASRELKKGTDCIACICRVSVAQCVWVCVGVVHVGVGGHMCGGWWGYVCVGGCERERTQNVCVREKERERGMETGF